MVGRPCHHLLQVALEAQQGQAVQQGPGHHHDLQVLEALFHPRTATTWFTFCRLETLELGGGRRKINLQELPSLQQDLGDPEDQVGQTSQLDQLHQQDLSHRENPVNV